VFIRSIVTTYVKSLLKIHLFFIESLNVTFYLLAIAHLAELDQTIEYLVLLMNRIWLKNEQSCVAIEQNLPK